MDVHTLFAEGARLAILHDAVGNLKVIADFDGDGFSEASPVVCDLAAVVLP